MVHVERSQVEQVECKREVMSSTRHADLLEREVSLLQAKVEQQAATIRDLHAEAVEQARLREAAEVEVVEQREDIVEQACDQGNLENEIQRLERERAELRGNLVRVKADLAQMEHKYDEARRHLADKEELARKPEMELAQKDRKIQQLQRQLDEKAILIKTIKEQLEEARKNSPHLESDVVEEETRDRLLQRLSSAHREQAFSEEKCWQLEEQLEDRDRALQEAQSKLQSLEDRLRKQEERLQESDERSRAVADKSSEESQIQALRGDIEDRDRQLQHATKRIADVDEMVSQLQAKLKACGSESQAELQMVKKRCTDLEIAGKKLLLELDEKDRQIHAKESAMHVAQRRVSDLEATLGSARSPMSADAASSTEGPVSVGKRGENNDLTSTQRVWVSGSCRDSGSEVRASGSGGESSLDETLGTRRLRRVRVPQSRHDDLVQLVLGEGKQASPLRRRHASPALLRERGGMETPSRKLQSARCEEATVTWRGRRHCGPPSEDHLVSSREQSESDSGHSGTRTSDTETGVRWRSRQRGGTPLRRLLEEGITGIDGGHDVRVVRDSEEVWKWKAAVDATSRSGTGGSYADDWLANSSWCSRYDRDRLPRSWDDTAKWGEGGDAWSNYNYSSSWNSYFQ